ncbi:MAG TPA: prepilin-type N-terminal cleavage/methylation domain-containing protein [Pirellulales bacterium]|jgi:type II secretion system protein G|nr:prepilin-type N-terminal cleavage/methylation domain-containing protein [Pirellulales bacterium]
MLRNTFSLRGRQGFTLIEVMIVVVILAVLAAILIPNFFNITDDAKASSLKHNLYTLRAQIEMYKLSHNGAVPALQNGALAQLISATNANGDVGLSGPNYPFGPYLSGGVFPVNPYDGKNTITAIGAFPPAASTTDGGWFYCQAAGAIAANTDGHLAD